MSIELTKTLAPFAIGYLFIFTLIIGWIFYRQTQKSLEFISFFFFTVFFGWVTCGLAYTIGSIILKQIGRL